MITALINKTTRVNAKQRSSTLETGGSSWHKDEVIDRDYPSAITCVKTSSSRPLREDILVDWFPHLNHSLTLSLWQHDRRRAGVGYAQRLIRKWSDQSFIVGDPAMWALFALCHTHCSLSPLIYCRPDPSSPDSLQLNWSIPMNSNGIAAQQLFVWVFSSWWIASLNFLLSSVVWTFQPHSNREVGCKFFSQGLLNLKFYFFGSTRHEHEQTRNSSTLTISSGKWKLYIRR